MNNIKVWKNTSIMDEFSEGIEFTNRKAEADIVLLGSKPINLKDFEKLRGIFRAGVGIDNIPFEECKSRNILVELPSEKTKNFLFEEAASFTVSLIMRMLFPDPEIKPPWKKSPREGLENKKALVIGLGNIGSRVKNKLEGIMSVTSYDILDSKKSDLKNLISEADILSLHIPSTAENINFFDYSMFKLMKKGAILVNTARANLVDEEELYKFIEQDKIKAAFDVFWEEPYNGKLIEFYPDRFYMTPHIASSTVDFLKGCRFDLDKMISRFTNDR